MPVYVPRQFGFNGRETFCPTCLGPTDKILMMGSTHKFTCIHCGMLHLGAPDSGCCVKCGCNRLRDEGESVEGEKFANWEPCDPCRDKIRKVEAVVELGGLRWRCEDCGSFGAFSNTNPVVDEFRKRFPDAPVWNLRSENCPDCQSRKKEPPTP